MKMVIDTARHHSDISSVWDRTSVPLTISIK